MKALYLMYSRIKQYFLKNKLVFILFVLGGMLNTIMLSYCYGNLLTVVLTRNSTDQSYMTYTYNYKDGTVTADQVKAFLKTDLFREVYVRTDIPLSQVPGSNKSVIIPYHKDNVFELYEGTMEFTAPNQVLVPYECEYQVGDTLIIFDAQLEIIGRVSSPFINANYVVPLDTFLEMGMHEKINSIVVVPKERQDFLHGNDAVEALVNSTVSGYWTAMLPSLFVSTMITQTIIAVPGIIATYIIAVLSYIFLLRYLVDATMNETIISMIIGARKSTMTVSIFWETTILSLATGILGVVVHILLYQPVFRHFNVHDYVTYSPIDYLNILIVVFSIGLIVVFPVVVKYMRLPPLAARRAHT